MSTYCKLIIRVFGSWEMQSVACKCDCLDQHVVSHFDGRYCQLCGHHQIGRLGPL